MRAQRAILHSARRGGQASEPRDRGSLRSHPRLELSLTACFLRQDFISFGSGEPPASEYHSFVLYHNNSPRWAELLKLPIPVDKFRGAHLRFEFRHCSSKCFVGAGLPPELRCSGGQTAESV